MIDEILDMIAVVGIIIGTISFCGLIILFIICCRLYLVILPMLFIWCCVYLYNILFSL